MINDGPHKNLNKSYSCLPIAKAVFHSTRGPTFCIREWKKRNTQSLYTEFSACALKERPRGEWKMAFRQQLINCSLTYKLAGSENKNIDFKNLVQISQNLCRLIQSVFWFKICLN